MLDNIILIGLKASGKTSIGKLYAEINKDYNFIDIDELIKKLYINKSISEIYKILGEEKFREIESELIADLTDKILNTKLNNKSNINHIIATGGGVVLNKININNLKKIGKIVYLYCDPKIIYKRWQKNNIKPEFVCSHGELDLIKYNNYTAVRCDLYNNFADFVINASIKNIKDITNNIDNLSLINNGQ